MNTFFVNITESLDLKKDDDSSLNPINSENINDILEKHKKSSQCTVFWIREGRSSKRRNYESRSL